jgi:hypothetical protein
VERHDGYAGLPRAPLRLTAPWCEADLVCDECNGAAALVRAGVLLIDVPSDVLS